MKTPLVSILMTAYNHERYIGMAIESVLASTLKDFELIIVDDGSKDRTVEVARRYLTDPRVQIHVNEKNLGDYPNRNRAAALARGKYLKYIDGDDYLYPHGLSVILGMMEQFPEAMIGFASLEQDAKRPFPFQLSPREAYQRHYFERSIFHKAPLSVIMRADAFRDVGGFTGKRWVGDYELWHILSAKYPVLLMPEGMVWYRVHEQQELRKYLANPIAQFTSLLIANEQLMKPDCPLLSSERARAIRQIERRQARSIFRMLSQRRFGLACEMFQMAKMAMPKVLLAAFAN
jgi:glycosyltransferase involved in cell wall biosynthesis